MRLHLIGIFHTKCTEEYSHCAFTGKVFRFSRMMKPFGWTVIEYSNEGSESIADKHEVMLTNEEFSKVYREKKMFHGDSAVIGSPGHVLFESRLIEALKRNVQPRDLICHPFGHSHERIIDIFNKNIHVETGIGYPTLMSRSIKIFESYAWMHYHQGKEKRNGNNYEWVIPNYFDVDEWEPSYEKGKYIAFLGRICSDKGMDTIKEIANHTKYKIILHGQGNPVPWRHPNIEYRGPITGKQRSEFLRNAVACLMPTVFVEPFGGSGVEAMLCGTPLIAVDYGAFTETIIDGVTGFRCHTLKDWLDAIEKAENLDRQTISDLTRQRYNLSVCGKQYDRVFKDVQKLYRGGWYDLLSPS